MLKRITLLILVLPLFFIPSSFASTNMVVDFHNEEVNIGSDLIQALNTKSYALAEDTEMVESVLLFNNELTPGVIRVVESTGIRFSRQRSSIVHVGRVYLASVPTLDSLYRLSRYGLESATLGKKQFFPSLMSSVPSINAPETWNLKDNDLQSIDGTGSTVAIIDTGIYWMHPTFWRATTDNITVISDGGDYYADLDNDSVADFNEGPIAEANEGSGVIDADEHYLFIDINDDGSFDYTDGDRWLGGFDANDDGLITLPTEPVVLLGESKVKLLYDQNSGNVYQRGVNLTSQAPVNSDSHGHGTHVASIVAGGQRNLTSMLGSAPNADLIIIRSPLDSASIIDGIYFAMETEADVINMSFSSYLGFLDGSDLEDIAITEAFRTKGIISTLAAGNLGGRSKHAHMDIGPGSLGSAGLSVSNPGQFSFLNVLWKSSDQDEHVILVSPQDVEIDLGAFSSIRGNAYLLDEEYIQAYVFADVSIKGTNRVIVQIATNEHQWNTGAWRLDVTNPEGETISVDCYAWDNNWGGTNLRFTSSIENTCTLSSPGTSDLGVCVTSYDEGTGQISFTSSRGPRIDDMPITIIAAPGSDILAAYPSLNTLWTQRSGTSMAAPHVAGVLALLKQVTGNTDGWLEHTALSTGAGGFSDHYDSPDNSWGYGLVDALWSVRHLQKYPLTNDTTLEDWIGFDPVVSDPADSWIADGLDIRDIRMIRNLSWSYFATSFNAMPNFVSDNVLTIDLDVDSNLGTGKNGAEYQYNVTNGAVYGYQWSGSSFVSISTVNYIVNDSSTVFVQVEHPSTISSGRFRITTSNSTHTLDIISYTDMINQWRPLVNSIEFDYSNNNYQIEIVVSDEDTRIANFNIEWELLDGFSESLLTDSLSQSDTYSFSINTSQLEHETLARILIFELTSDSDSYQLSPIVLSEGYSANFGFSSTVLSATEFRSGFLIEEYIEGEFALEGHLLVDAVSISFKSSIGTYLNLTLNGENGIYHVKVATNVLTPGEYSVYAVAESIMGVKIVQSVGTIRIIEDNTMLFLLGGTIIGVLVVVTALRQIMSKKERS
ncbi:MAG: S8 family serine peptidase [Candidatus Lokiarchaeota archaeon]|nr:S8 family serine peptidase [Candidatus Lokiarchaeota archaeon]